MKTKKILYLALFALMGWTFMGCSCEDDGIIAGDAKTRASQLILGSWELYATGAYGQRPCPDSGDYLVFKEGGYGTYTYRTEEGSTAVDCSFQLGDEWTVDDESNMLVGELYHSVYGQLDCMINKKNMILQIHSSDINFIQDFGLYYQKIK